MRIYSELTEEEMDKIANRGFEKVSKEFAEASHGKSARKVMKSPAAKNEKIIAGIRKARRKSEQKQRNAEFEEIRQAEVEEETQFAMREATYTARERV